MPPALLGLAHHLPPPQPVGSVQRPIAVEPGGPSDLAIEPARRALSEAGLAPEEIEFLVFATMTPDVTFPGAACYFQNKFGLGTIGALDVRGQCAGFLTGLMIAHDFIRAGVYRTVLLAAGEVHSSGLDYSERGEAVARLYGDGAAVTVLGERGGGGVESVVCHGDGQHHERFWIEYPSSRQHPLRVTVEDLRAGKQFPRLDVEHVERFGAEHLPAVVREALAAADVTAGAVDCFIFSHVLPAVVERSAASLGLPAAKVIAAGALHGHLTAAALPVALSEARSAGRIAAGARVCLAACGAGYAWGAAVLTV
jgi:3-oxoacyl-[acyl-carrier-protein] synthase III